MSNLDKEVKERIESFFKEYLKEVNKKVNKEWARKEVENDGNN